MGDKSSDAFAFVFHSIPDLYKILKMYNEIFS